MREWIRNIALRLTAPLGVGVVLGLIGPFGTYDLLPLLPRLGYWLAVVSLNWALADAGIRRVEAVAGDRLPAPGTHADKPAKCPWTRGKFKM